MDKYIVGLFDDDEVLLNAVKTIRNAGVKITEVLTPFPVHGLDSALGMKDSRLHKVGFIAGAIGLILALTFIIWTSSVSYPLNIGGKPYLSLPAYIPIIFEITVLFACVSMVIVFFARCDFSPFKYPRIFDERITDDKFAMTFAITEKTTEENINQIKTLLNENGAVEINEKKFETDQ